MVVNNKKEIFYLFNWLVKVFLIILKKGILVDFEVISFVIKLVDNYKVSVYLVLYFNLIM